MKVITDCAADLTAEDIARHEITVAPLYIRFPEGEISSDQLNADEFYDRLAAMSPAIPTTSQPSSELFTRIYEKFLQLGEEVLSVHISSGLSGTFASASGGATQINNPRTQVFDSQTLSGGQRFQVLAAARAQKAGWSMERILERLAQIRQHTEVTFTLDTLTYLARGGRIGRVQALAGALLHIKPLIRVDHADGKYSTLGKARTIPQALDAITTHMAKKFGDTAVWVSVMHGRFHEQAEALRAQIEQRLNVGRMEVLRISPVLGVHTGPGVVGAAVLPLQQMEGF